MNFYGTCFEKPAYALRDLCFSLLDKVVVGLPAPELAEQEKTIEDALREVYGKDIKIMWIRGRDGLSVSVSFVDGLKGRTKYSARVSYYGNNHHHLLNVIALVYFRMKEKVRTELRIDDR